MGMTFKMRSILKSPRKTQFQLQQNKFSDSCFWPHHPGRPPTAFPCSLSQTDICEGPQHMWAPVAFTSSHLISQTSTLPLYLPVWLLHGIGRGPLLLTSNCCSPNPAWELIAPRPPVHPSDSSTELSLIGPLNLLVPLDKCQVTVVPFGHLRDSLVCPFKTSIEVLFVSLTIHDQRLVEHQVKCGCSIDIPLLPSEVQKDLELWNPTAQGGIAPNSATSTTNI
jgi:hypothetical protein